MLLWAKFNLKQLFLLSYSFGARWRLQTSTALYSLEEAVRTGIETWTRFRQSGSASDEVGCGSSHRIGPPIFFFFLSQSFNFLICFHTWVLFTFSISLSPLQLWCPPPLPLKFMISSSVSLVIRYVDAMVPHRTYCFLILRQLLWLKEKMCISQEGWRQTRWSQFWLCRNLDTAV